MADRKKLTDILHGSDRERFSKAWHEMKAAEEFGPLPAGEYVARVIDGTLANAKTGTPSYKLTFQIVEGDHAGRRFWHDVYLTEAALPMAKRDLVKLGIKDLAQLDSPLPHGIRCKVRLALRREDDGNERNRVVRFDVIGIDPPTPDPFAPADASEGKPPAEAVEPPGTNGETKVLFAFGANAGGAGPYSEGR